MPAPTRQLPPKRSSGSVLDRIQPIQAPERGLRMAVYGRSGTGKTTFACTFPKPLLFIRPPDDDGRLSVSNVAGVDDVDLQSTEELQQISQWIINEKPKYKTVVLDNASALQELVLKKVLGVSQTPAQLGWGVATQSQWGDVGLGMKELLRELLHCQTHVVILCQEREFNTEDRGEILAPYVSTALSPSVTGWLGPSVDYLVQTFERVVTEKKIKKVGNKELEVGEEVHQYCLRTGPHPVYSTKFRVPKGTPLPDVIVDPTYEKIAAILGRPVAPTARK